MRFAVLWATGKVTKEDFPDGCEWLVLPLPMFSSIQEVRFKRQEFCIRGENPRATLVVFIEEGTSRDVLENYVNAIIAAKLRR